MLQFIFLLFLFIFLLFNSHSTKLRSIHDTANLPEKLFYNSTTPFQLQQLLESCGEETIRVESYLDSNKLPSLYALKDSERIPLKEWFSTPLRQLNGKASKLDFDANTKITTYFSSWLNRQEDKLPVLLREKLAKLPCKSSLKLTANKWHYPVHFDCTDNFLLVVSGARECIIAGKRRYFLRAGDIIYFPAGVEHEFWCDNNEINIMVGLAFVAQATPNNQALQERFSCQYPLQIERLVANVDST